ncbi:MAG: metal ABC transporter permease [Thermoproteales archaeon]|nr:metal ABC transporter permease [Thermoproteales archaeon]
MLEIIALIYLLALLSGILVGSISLPLVMSRNIMFSLTLLHSILGGAILGVFINTMYNLNIPIPLFATFTAIFFSILAAELVEKGFPEDTATAFSVAAATTITIVFSFYASSISSTALAEAWSYVMGASSLATLEDLTKIIVVLIITIPIVHLFWREFKYIAFDPEGAEALGLNVRFYRYLFYSIVAFVSAVLSSTVGVLVAHVILAAPGAFALKIYKKKPVILSYIISTLLMLTGYILARILNIPPSGGVGLTSTILILSMVILREHD